MRARQATTEESIVTKESDYLEATPSGNIVLGFDNYVKGANTAAAQRRKTGLADQNRVFSRSSVSYNPAAAVRSPVSHPHPLLFILHAAAGLISTGMQQDAQTPGSTPAPTPMSSTFGGGNRDGPSGAPTPSSTGGGGGGRAGTSKKGKKMTAAQAAAAAAAGEDSETDGRETKKVRTSFGARK